MRERTKVKICGLRTLADVEAVDRYLPDYVGFVFAHTRRFVTDEQAFMMKRALDWRIRSVGVFVDEPMEHILRLCEKGIIDMIQLHGAESEEQIRQIREKSGLPVIKAIRIERTGQTACSMSCEADYLLFDTCKKGVPGGTGERFPLELLEAYIKDIRKPYFLAGGLDPWNVSEAIGRTGCPAVDVSTGVETDGVKDADKIRQFIEQARGAVS